MDEAKDIADKADAMRAYAKQAQNTELETAAAEIKLRAQRRVGELSRELETEQGQRTDKLIPAAGKKSRREALKAAGISTSEAHRFGKIDGLGFMGWRHRTA